MRVFNYLRTFILKRADNYGKPCYLPMHAWGWLARPALESRTRLSTHARMGLTPAVGCCHLLSLSTHARMGLTLIVSR